MNVILYGKRDLADVITLKSLRFRDDPRLPSEPKPVARVLTRGGNRVRVREGDAISEAELGVVGGHRPRNVGRLWKPEKARNKFPPRTYKRNTALLSP